MNVYGGSFSDVYTANKKAITSNKVINVPPPDEETMQYYDAWDEATREPFALTISDDGRLVSDWFTHFERLFNRGMDEISGNTLEGPLLDTFAPYGGYGAYDDFFSMGAGVYTKIKEDIDAAYGDDHERKKLLMFALDKAFESYIYNKTKELAFHIKRQSEQYAEEMKSTGDTDSERAKTPFSPVFMHKEFNADDFRKNLVQMGRDFVAAFTQGAKFGLDAAWKNVDRLLGGMETTSVNNISYSDFRAILGGISNNQIASKDDTWDKALSSLANNTNLSGYMRDIFSAV